MPRARAVASSSGLTRALFEDTAQGVGSAGWISALLTTTMAGMRDAGAMICAADLSEVKVIVGGARVNAVSGAVDVVVAAIAMV